MNSLDVPTVSIVIPTFNRDKLLQETIQSVQKQTFENWEIIVVDDGSNDKTEGTMMHFSKSDSRIRYVQRNSSQKGASVCRNEGTELSRGDYVIYLDSDDLLSPTTLEYRLKAMEHYPDLDFGVFQAILFRDQPGDTRLLWNIDSEENDIDRFLALDIPWQTTSPIWRRKALLRLGPWNGSLPSWQDWEYHLRALIEGLKYKKFPIPDFFLENLCSFTKTALASISKIPKLQRIYLTSSNSNRSTCKIRNLICGNSTTISRKTAIYFKTAGTFWRIVLLACLNLAEKWKYN